MDKIATRTVELINKYKGAHILVYGDLMLDQYTWGEVNRICPEAPVVVVDVRKEEYRAGGAGNVVRNLVALGAKVSVCGAIGDDLVGQELISAFTQLGVNTGGIVVAKGRPTTLKTRIIARNQQVVRVDKEERAPFDPEVYAELNKKFENLLESASGIIVSDYGKGIIASGLFQVVTVAHKNGLIGLNSRPLIVDPKFPHYDIYNYASVVKPNRKEAQEATGIIVNSRSKAIEAARVLMQKWNAEVILVTLGEDGMVLVARDSKKYPTVEIDTVAQEVFDVSGAGDTVAAVLATTLAVKGLPHEAAELANYAAGIAIAEVGTVSVPAEDLLKAALRRGL